MPARPVRLLATLVLATTACGGADEPPEPTALAPHFAPETGAVAPPPAPATAPPAHPADPSATSVPAVVPTATPTPTPSGQAPVLRASTLDRHGDVTPAIGDDAPAWADLTGAALQRTDGGFELRVSLGAAAPARAPDGERTMNVAAFFDVDGDGALDYEVWANLAAGGWGGAWFDDRTGTARFLDESGVTAGAEDGVLVVRFPAGHVGGVTGFRWSVASEWGRHGTIGTAAAARDEAPDGDRAVDFPG